MKTNPRRSFQSIACVWKRATPAIKSQKPRRRLRSAKSLGILTAVASLVALIVAALFVTNSTSAATPTSGTLSEAAPVLTYNAGPFNVTNQSPLGAGQLDQGPRCNAQFPCDNFALTVSLPAGYASAHPNASVKVTMYWTDTSSGQSDYDLYIYRGVVGNLGGNQQADYQAASQANPEVGSITPLADGDNTYSLKIVPYTPTQEIVHVRMELLSGTGGGGFPGFGGPDPTTPGAPRYQNFIAPSGSSAEPGNGEFNIGFNPSTGRIMTMNSGPIWRLTPPERLDRFKPECCEALWEDVSAPSTIIGVDPILWTDQKTGRTLASNSTAGTNGIYAYSDDDGDLWNPISAAPPNASTDHETIGSGPYPASMGALATPANQGQAVYYCAQTWPVGAAACQRSDTLGSSYGPSTLPYDGNTTQCGGIHGHVRVGPDGTVYLPVRDCSGNAGVAISTDAGITWTEHVVPNSKTQTHGSDPSIAIGANNTVYFFYVADQTSSPQDPTEGHIHVQVSTNHGTTWSKDTDLGTSHGIKNAVFPEAIAGDDNRVACGFLGTDRPGDYEGASFPGLWYLFIATSYDGGDNWTIVNVTPNDPVQGVGGIWLGGGSNTNRNLLDFNEVTLDDKGRVLFGYSDGCVGNCVGDPSHNSYVAHMRVARQFGGKSLFASKDIAEPTVPKPSCLSGVRDANGSHLSWKAPDNGGSDIVNYQIFRGTAPSGEAFVGETGNAKTSYHDTTADPSLSHYYYVVKAINSRGTGNTSNEVDLVATAAPSPTPTPSPAPCGSATNYPNLAGIQTGDNSPGSPYPSQINVSGLSGTVTKLTVNLNGVTHAFPDDIDVLLVGPGGQNAIIMSDVGGRIPTQGVTLTLDDAATTALLDEGPLVSGTFKPTNVGAGDPFPAPAPAPSGGSALSVFNGTDPNGTWNLYVLDDESIDRGTLSGWTINITTNCGGPNPTPSPTPANSCVSATELVTDPGGDQQDPILPQPGATQLDVRSLSAGEDYRYLNSERLSFKLKVDNLNTIPAGSVWRVIFDFTPPGGTLTTYYVAMTSDENSGVSYDYGTQSGNLLTSLGGIEEGSYTTDGIVTMTLAMSKVGDTTKGIANAGASLANVGAQTEQATDLVAGTLFSTVDDTSKAGYTVGAKNAACTPVPPPPPPGSATYVKGGMTFSPNYALRAAVASRDGEPSLRVDKLGNAYVAGIRGVPAGVDLWYFDLSPSSPTYDPYMRNPIYRGQPDQFSPDEAMEVGADGGGDVDLAVGFDPASPGQPPYLAFSSLVLANVSTARSTDRGATFTKNPVGSTTGGIPVDDRQWMEFYGKDSVYLLYRTVAPTIAFVQRSNDGGLTYGAARMVGAIGQVGGIDVDQNDGTVYVSGNTGVVAVGIPPAPGMEPLTYTVHNVAGSGKATIFFTVKVASDGTVYVCYSDGKNVFIKYSKDKGTNWSPEIRISDGPETATSLLPWLETGPTPGSIGVVWYGSTATSNSDNADWKVFFAQSANITSPNPTVRQAEVSDHFIHGSNISLAGLPLNPTTPSGNRNLIDYFQIGFDPTGAAVIAFTDDHNDFDGHTYVSRQISGPSVNGGTVPSPTEGSNLPPASAPGPKPSVESVGGIAGSQVTDFRHDTRTSNATIDVDDPFDVVSIKYSTEGSISAPVLVATMKVSDLAIIPSNGTWRVNFTANAPGAASSPTGDYNFGLSDRGDQFFLRANTDLAGNQSFVYGTTARRHFVAGGGGGFDYTDQGLADGGSFDAAGDTITIKVSLSKLNATLAAGHAPLGPGSVLAGLRGSAFTAVQGNNGRSDSTRGGTVFQINSAPTAALTATPRSGYAPLAVNFDGSGSRDPDAGDSISSYTFNFGDGTVVTQSSPTIAHTYTAAAIYTARLTVADTHGAASTNTAEVLITVSDRPTIDCLEDDDSRIGYSNGWHLVNNGNASAGHFRMHSGADSRHSASLSFTVGANRVGSFTYTYARSTKGGQAEVFIDGISRGFINYRGNAGSNKSPEFKSNGIPYEARYDGLAPGPHRFELRNMNDSVYIDGFCLQTTSTPQPVSPPGGSVSQNSWSDSGSPTAPGTTNSNDNLVSGGQQSSFTMNLGPNAREISVVAETTGAVPIKLILVDPAGLTLQMVDAVNGVAVINVPVNVGGLYTLKVVNVSLGPVQVWTVATPLVAR